MRISTSTIFDTNVTSLNQQQSKLLYLNQQITSGRRVLTPADDPAAAARALNVSQADSANTQYTSNIGVAQDTQTLSEGILQGVTTLLQDVQSTALSAGNPGQSDADRKMLGNELQSKLEQLSAMANTKDAVGNYLFSGFQGSTQPFVNTPTGVQYMGDDGQRMIQVSANRQLAASDSGADIFMRIKNGNGTFLAQPDPTSNAGLGNAGSGVISAGSLAVPPPTAAQLGNKYTVSFAVAAGVTTYQVLDVTAGPPGVAVPAPAPTGNAYVSGQNITFNGIQFSIHGAPANGDQFAITPSTNESVFKTISDLINTLNIPLTSGSVASSTQMTSGLDRALGGLSNALDSILTTRASLGSRLNELDSLKSTEADLGIQYKQTLSQLQDLDYNKAITDLTLQKTMLEAAQKSFLQVQNLSMFNYMP